MLERVYKPLRIIQNEAPSGDIDGHNVTFTSLYLFDPASVVVYLNGLRLKIGSTNDYTLVADNTILFNYSPIGGDEVTIDYHRK